MNLKIGIDGILLVMSTFDCLIPFYNEDVAMVQSVIATLYKMPNAGLIICIDDGSTNDTYQRLRMLFGTTKRVRIIRSEKNAGKSEAFRRGLSYARSDVVFTVDADMSNLRTDELVFAYNSFRKGGYDLLILRLVEEPKQARNFRGDILLSGERFIRTALFRDIIKNKNPHGYSVEMVTNRYVMDHGLRYGYVPCTAHNIQPIDKLGLAKGIQKEFRQLSDILLSVGIFGFLDTYVRFCKGDT